MKLFRLKLEHEKASYIQWAFLSKRPFWIFFGVILILEDGLLARNRSFPFISLDIRPKFESDFFRGFLRGDSNIHKILPGVIPGDWCLFKCHWSRNITMLKDWWVDPLLVAMGGKLNLISELSSSQVVKWISHSCLMVKMFDRPLKTVDWSKKIWYFRRIWSH